MKLTKELFEDVIIYRMSEVGAMGPARTLECLKSNGEHFELEYLSEETPWEEIKKKFPGINGCIFNGPTRSENMFSKKPTIVIGDDGTEKTTRVNSGWKHIWLDYGNHLVCKEEVYYELKDIIKDMDNCDITFSWIEKLKKAGFTNRLDKIVERYNIQKQWDEEFTRNRTEWSKEGDES